MKKLLVIILFSLSNIFLAIYSQNQITKDNISVRPELFRPKNHEQSFRVFKQFPVKSFYKSKSEWQHIIDSTWGPGDSLQQKLLIFNTYAQNIHDQFDGFITLNLNWDSLYNFYLKKINYSTSRGAFSAIMSHFAYDLKDIHTKAYDSTVVFTPLNPGVPILLLGSYFSVEHFGAVTTVLPDSTTLVLRVVNDHPLGLQPGDIILGYEGIPWKKLVKELLSAGLPMIAITGGCKSADTYLNLSGAGMNWHLFDTIDILKYSTGDTLHLSVMPLMNLNVSPMVNNEQMQIPNISFPNVLSDQCVTYGILENTNIGYIFLSQEWPTSNAEIQFSEAINSLKNTDALIMDMRLNYGGWALFYNAFQMLFNETYNTLVEATRCNSSSYQLCPSQSSILYKIDGKPPELYDRPIAVLLGPTCVSMGDLTAQRLKYHPMVKIFGASSDASLGTNIFMYDFPGWFLRYSISDVFHINSPGVYLNKKEFPIDFPVWHNRDEVARGKDAVVEKALNWIENLVFSHNLKLNNIYYRPGIDTIKISDILENPNAHQTLASIYINNSDGKLIDTLFLNKSGESNKSEYWKGNFLAPDMEDFFNLSLSAKDLSDSKIFNSNNIYLFTTAGPVTVDSIKFIKSKNYISIRPFLHNHGSQKTIRNVSVKLLTEDPYVTLINPNELLLDDIPPGSTIGASTWSNIKYIDSLYNGNFNIKFEIMSDSWVCWRDSIHLTVTGINKVTKQPLLYYLKQNYPNPFNPSTTIEYSLKKRENVNISVYNTIGEKVSVVLNEEKEAGSYKVKFNASSLPSGVYFYRIKAGDFTSVKKMMLLK